MNSDRLNPYASQLGGRSPQEVISQTPGLLSDFIQKLGPEGMERPLAPGKWNARQIITHLADTEIAFAFRLRQALADDHHTIQPFDQDRWALNYSAYDGSTAAAMFSALRAWNMVLIRSLPAEAYQKPVTHPERGSMTFQTLVETMGGHDINHLQQLEKIASV